MSYALHRSCLSLLTNKNPCMISHSPARIEIRPSNEPASIKKTDRLLLPPFLAGRIRLCCLLVVGCNAQLRYFFTWTVAEGSLTLAGFNWLGADEQGKPRW